MYTMRKHWWPVALVSGGLTLLLVAGLTALLHKASSAPSAGAPGSSDSAGLDPSGDVYDDLPSPSPSSASPSTSPSPSPGTSAQAPPGTVYFQDTGDVHKWSNYPQRPQKSGVIRTVTNPSYKGGTSIEAQQTYVNEGGGYHSETIQAHAERLGEDKYYGQVVYFPPNWQSTPQSITIQQFSPEDPEGPWLLMFMENNRLRLGGSGGIAAQVGQMIPGIWMRIVVRLKLAPNGGGAVEVWLNGVKTVSMLNRTVLPKTGTTIRWSSGIYCNSWRTETPVGPRQISVFHAHARIASSYALAEPANW
jgi:hypothetical protein